MYANLTIHYSHRIVLLSTWSTSTTTVFNNLVNRAYCSVSTLHTCSNPSLLCALLKTMLFSRAYEHYDSGSVTV